MEGNKIVNYSYLTASIGFKANMIFYFKYKFCKIVKPEKNYLYGLLIDFI